MTFLRKEDTRWLVRLNAVISHGSGSHTESFGIDVTAPSAIAAVGEAIAEFHRTYPDVSADDVTMLPWAWELDVDGKKIDSGVGVPAAAARDRMA